MTCLETLAKLIAVSKGEERGDLLLKNCRVVNVFSGEILKTSVLVQKDTIAGVGDGYRDGKVVADLQGAYLLPGFIDAHIHIESSLLTPAGFAAAVLPHGTTSVVCDPHEIANVAGLRGIEFMYRSGRGLPLDFYFMIPSCVPSTHLETAGAVLDDAAITEAFTSIPASTGLAEMMNYPGVLAKDPGVLAKIAAARDRDLPVDGHAPMLGGEPLNAYISAGIDTDHECISREEALEKVRLGMKVIIREGSAARNLAELLPAVNPFNASRFMFGCDDRHPGQLAREGEMDDILRKAVRLGLDPATAIRMATLNTARHYRLKGKGAVAPGYRADLVVVEDLVNFKVLKVYKDGKEVAAGGKVLVKMPAQLQDAFLENSLRLPALEGAFELHIPPQGRANVITVSPGQIVTGWEKIPCSRLDFSTGEIAKVCVMERYSGEGNCALGLVRGFGLQQGALASTVAHDSHNLIVIGAESRSMEKAAETVKKMGGGMAVVKGDELLASLPLPVGGLMSYGDASLVGQQYEQLERAASTLGCTLPSPFMTLSFLALPVIPALKITDQGLVDVAAFRFVPLFEPAAGEQNDS